MRAMEQYMTRLGQFSVTGRRAPARWDVGELGVTGDDGGTGRGDREADRVAFSRSVSTRAPGSNGSCSARWAPGPPSTPQGWFTGVPQVSSPASLE